MTHELPAPVGAGTYNVYTGRRFDAPQVAPLPAAAGLGLEPPRFCADCGRRMVVQVRPDGWRATCSRHGPVDSTELEPRR